MSTMLNPGEVTRAVPGSLEFKVAQVVATVIKAVVAPLQERITALEAKPALEYAGVYLDGKAYREGQIITRNGGAWLCLRPTCDVVPGSDPAFWKLIVKEGRSQ
jgi:hypothetical protein